MQGRGFSVTKIGARSAQVILGDERLWMCGSDFKERAHTPGRGG